MIYSMTGFARAEASGDWGELAWELRSVNHRYLDLNLRIPEALREIEPQVRTQAAEVLGRGKVECNLRYAPEATAGGLEIDETRLAALAEGCRRVADTLEAPGPVDPLRVLQWPGVVREAETDSEAVVQTALRAFGEALAELKHNRAAEGEKLDGFFRARLREIEELVERVQTRLPQVQDEWRQRLESRLAELEQPVDPGRIEQEVVFAAQKSDVEEELSRLRMHVSAFAEALGKQGPVGRRLDFLMQEFNREANTLSSKSQDADIRQMAVDMKVLIEQMREQVQNVE